MPTSIALFTRDLRVHDNPVLRAACQADHVVPLFVVDPGIARAGFAAPNRAVFLADCLADLDANLRDRGGRLVVRRGEVVEQVREVADQVGADTVHVADDVSGYAQRRLRGLREMLERGGRELVAHDPVVTALAPGDVTPSGKSKDHFAVFTPYHRQWEQRRHAQASAAPRSVSLPRIAAGSVPGAADLGAPDGPDATDLPKGGESEGRERLTAWVREVEHYDEQQDRLTTDGTSRLSPYLHFGCLSATEVAQRVGTDSAGAAGFVRQLAWRDFHHQVLAARPRAAREDYRTRDDRWRRGEAAERDFEAWRQGRTGYPIVDAGLRQLLAQGWMHNRARLITGSFLTKTLYLDWRWGAEHFLAHLVDGDVANNQLNWQWVAGTGTDTRPNRVLNPLAQAKKLDPDGAYVRRWVPELADVAGSRVHEPWKLAESMRTTLDYPDPIVDLDEAGERFRAARGLDR
ncbi:MAG TPA: deoxyribodipyrimidine photo-lyase [Pseudonocardia sp.]|jgi:deoxyribodipyrimidine photo-lyase|nr:deoxyribodipyrimidine photo-lyase [Pseudonocardia sp.]